MTTFADYLRHYNNYDVIGLVIAIEKMLAVEKSEGLDIFKNSISLPTLTKQYLFNKLPAEDYFTGFSSTHSHIYKDMRNFGIVGGPSIIFHRYHEAGITKIKNKHPCKKVVGLDANMLYLHCVGQNMPTGYYSLREEKNQYERQTNFSKEAISWLEYMSEIKGEHIRHALNSPHSEKRIANFSVDGFSSSSNTVYE